MCCPLRVIWQVLHDCDILEELPGMWYVMVSLCAAQAEVCSLHCLDSVAHLSNLMLHKELGWRSVFKAAAAAAGTQMWSPWWVSCHFSNAVNLLSRTKVLNGVYFVCTLPYLQEVLKEVIYFQRLQEFVRSCDREVTNGCCQSFQKIQQSNCTKTFFFEDLRKKQPQTHHRCVWYLLYSANAASYDGIKFVFSHYITKWYLSHLFPCARLKCVLFHRACLTTWPKPALIQWRTPEINLL